MIDAPVRSDPTTDDDDEGPAIPRDAAPRPAAPEPTKPRFKMALRAPEYLVDFGGRVPAGAVLTVDEDTAVRWYENGVADPAAPDAPTFHEQQRSAKREEFLRRAVPVEGVYDTMISRDPNDAMPKPMPRPRAGSGRRRLDQG